MANSPTDKSNDFVQSGMTLITQQASDKYLNKVKKVKEEFDNQAEWADGFVGK